MTRQPQPNTFADLDEYRNKKKTGKTQTRLNKNEEKELLELEKSNSEV